MTSSFSYPQEVAATCTLLCKLSPGVASSNSSRPGFQVERRCQLSDPAIFLPQTSLGQEPDKCEHPILRSRATSCHLFSSHVPPCPPLQFLGLGPALQLFQMTHAHNSSSARSLGWGREASQTSVVCLTLGHLWPTVMYTLPGSKTHVVPNKYYSGELP